MTTYNITHYRGDTYKLKEFRISVSTPVSTITALPAVGTTGVIYKTLDTGLYYKWVSTVYAVTTDKVYRNLTGCTILWQIRPIPLMPVVYTMTTDITEPTNGIFEAPDQIIDIPGKVYVHDLQIISSTGVVETYFKGTFTVTDDVSRVT